MIADKVTCFGFAVRQGDKWLGYKDEECRVNDCAFFDSPKVVVLFATIDGAVERAKDFHGAAVRVRVTVEETA